MYEVTNGLNLGPDGKRFESGDTISDDELKRLTSRTARSWLRRREYIVPIEPVEVSLEEEDPE